MRGSLVSIRCRRWGAIGLLALLSNVACDGRKSAREGSAGFSSHNNYVGVLNLAMGAPESPINDGFLPQPAGESFVGLIRKLGRVEKDSRLRGLFLKLRGTRFGFAQAKEIGETVKRIRTSKKIPVVCHTHSVDNGTYWLLNEACSEIWVSAAGEVPTVGIGAELSYLKGALDKAGIRADMLAMGKYKSGGEALTRSSPSEDSLRNLQETLSELRDQWLSGISDGAEKAHLRRKYVEDGPWTPKRARELDLIHRVGFEDEAKASIFEKAKTKKTTALFGEGAGEEARSPLAELVRALAGARERGQGKKRIAVVPAVGGITMTASGPFGGGSGITAAAMTRTLRRLRQDDSVRAVVMRMDSPGGSPLASDLIWREMMLLREKKPIIVSIGGMSASGGYYIASGATKIVASETSIVGSIGVFGGKIVLGGALGKLGVTHHQVAASPEDGAEERATHMSPMTPWDDPTRERVKESMKRIYDLFVERVAQGRGMAASDVYATAEGEIFLATTGKRRGLIDELGGVNYAIELARREAKLPKDAPVVIEGAQESVLEALLLGPEPGAQELETALARFEKARMDSIARWAVGTSLDDMKPFAATLGPLFAGESVVAALPYALVVQ